MNMSYCRFQNTLNDLNDCVNALLDGGLYEMSAEELQAAKQLMKVADALLTYREDVNNFDPADVHRCNNCGDAIAFDLCEDCQESAELAY